MRGIPHRSTKRSLTVMSFENPLNSKLSVFSSAILHILINALNKNAFKAADKSSMLALKVNFFQKMNAFFSP